MSRIPLLPSTFVLYTSAMLRRIPLIILVLLLTGVTIALGQIVFAYQDYPFFFDEAIHANGGLALTVDLWNGDIPNFFRTFYQQGFYPPAFSLPKGLAFYWFGPSTLVARGFSTVCLISALLVIYFFGRRIWIDHRPEQTELGEWVGLTAVLLTLTSLPLLNASTHVMMEAPGLLISFVFLWLYYRTFAVSAVDGTFARPADSDKRGFVLTSLMLMAVFLTKYTYGVAMIGTVALMELSMLDWRSVAQLRSMGGGISSSVVAPLRAGFNRWLWLIGPFVLCLIIWLGTPYKLGEFLGYATAQPHEAEWSLAELLFYPRNITLQQLPSPLWSLVSVLGLVYAFQERHRPEVRLLLIYFVVGMAEMMVNFPKIPRFVVTFLPALHILTGLFLLSAFRNQLSVGGSRSAGHRPPITDHRLPTTVYQWSLIGLLSLSLIWAVPVLYGRYSTMNTLMSSQLKTAPSVNQISAWVDGILPDDSEFLVVNYFELINMESLAWSMVADGDWPRQPFSQAVMDGRLMGDPTAENIAQFRQDVTDSGVEYLLAIEGSDWGASWPPFAEQSQDLLTYLAHEEFEVEVVNRPEELLWLELMDQSIAEQVLAEERGTFNLKLILYSVNEQSVK